MKLFLEILKIIGISVATGLIILFFTSNNHFSCSALDTFLKVSSFALFLDFLKTILIAFGIWVVGLIIYFLIKKKSQIILFIYFPLLTAVSLYSFIIEASVRLPEENIVLKQEICKKSADDGMMLSFTDLNKKEYDFVNSKKNWLPSVPEVTKTINIEYFRDDFLGDYHLTIEIALSNGEKLDSIAYPKWILKNGSYFFEEYQD